MDLLLRLVAIAATFVFLAATGLMLLTFRRARRVTTASLLVPVLVSAAILVLYCVFLRASPSAGWLATALVAGAALGAIWARSHTLFRARDGGVRSQASLWYLAVWAAVLALNQLVVLAAGHASTVLVGLLVFSTGIAAGNGLALLRRVRILKAALALGLVALGLAAGADDVLLLLPRAFDVKPVGGWYRNRTESRRFTAKDLEGDPNPFRFRGEEVTQEHSSVDVHTGNDCPVEIRYRHEFRATFRRGTLTGTWKTHQRNFYRGCKHYPDGEYMRVNHTGSVTGRADADGRLSVTVEVADSECLDNEAGGWVRRNQRFDPWSFGLEFQLPVGELQSNQKLSPRPTPAPVAARPATATPVREARVGGGAAVAAPGTSPWGAAIAAQADGAAKPVVQEGDGPSAPAEGGGPAGEGPGEAPVEAPADEEPPVSPAAAAGAAAGAAVLSLLGAAGMLASSGVRPGDLLSPPPADDLEPPPSAPAPRDGDVRPGTGEVWDAGQQAWMGPEYARIQAADRAQVQRAQGVSAAESARESADIERDLRASEERQRAAGEREAEAARLFALEAAQRPETIEPYQPAWTDRVASGLEWAEYGADTGVSLLGELTGKPGQVLGRVYTVTKETVKGTSEGVAAYARGQGGALAGEGSAWVIAERAGIGLAKGGAKVGLDYAAGKVMDAAGRLAGRRLPDLPDLGEASLASVVREVASGAAEGATRRSVGIAVGKTAVSPQIQRPVGWAVEAGTGEKL